MQRRQERLEEYLTKVLEEGHGHELWQHIAADPALEDLEPVPLSADDQFLQAVEAFVCKHRFAIAMAHTRCWLRHRIGNCTRLIRLEQSHTTLSITEPPVNV